MKFKFRFHRGGLSESMETTVSLSTKEELIRVIGNSLKEWGDFNYNNLKIESYGFDDRINWNSHIVTLDGWGVIGFTDKSIDDDEEINKSI